MNTRKVILTPGQEKELQKKKLRSQNLAKKSAELTESFKKGYIDKNTYEKGMAQINQLKGSL